MRPVTTPALVTVAIAGVPDDQVPPDTDGVSVVDAPRQIVSAPEIVADAGGLLTDTGAVADTVPQVPVKE